MMDMLCKATCTCFCRWAGIGTHGKSTLINQYSKHYHCFSVLTLVLKYL